MKNKTRKSKKILMVAAIALMVALVAAMGTMTYSRYITTTSEPTQTATAAKWGYVLNANAVNMLGDTYKNDGGATATVDATGTIVVRGQAGADIVAPGTSGSMTISIGGSSQVLAQFKISITGTDIKYGTYLPIVWTFGGNTYNTITALNDAMADAAALTATWDDGQKAFVFTAASYTLSWAWDFGTDPERSAKDTLIGYKAADKAWAEIKDLKCATGAVYSTFVEGDDDAADEAIYGAIVHQLSFTLSATIEQIQG